VSHLAHLKQQIKSIQTTKKITHAVRLVSMSLYTKLEKQAVPLKMYTQSIKSIFGQLTSCASEWKNDIFFPGDVLDSNPLIIIVSTSKGLCGSFNTNLLRYLETSLFIEKQQVPRFITIGQKAIRFVKERNLGEIVSSYNELNSSNYHALTDDLVEKIIGGPVHYSSIVFYSNECRSFFLQKPRKVTLVPFAREVESLESGQRHQNSPVLITDDAIIWEQERTEVLDYLAVRYMKCSIMYMLFESLRAEYAARFLAMENSTNNAEKYLEKLTLQYNKLRQALITKEVSELSASFPSR
jgi:F-type H+-transporting ATPase subunit gamma